MNDSPIKFVYFGGEPIGVPVLKELKAVNLLPSLIVCNPDKPVGRKQTLTPPPVKVWADENNIPAWQPESIPANPTELNTLTTVDWDVFVVVAYNHILPKWFIDLPKHKTINVHPSLLPKLRGASPIRTAILEDMQDETGVSIMQLDEKMDHGPIIAQMKLEIAPENWPINGPELDEALARLGGSLLADTLPKWINGEIVPTDQEHEQATYCGRITKDMAELELNPYDLPIGSEAHKTFLKIKAYEGWPVTFFRYENKRYKVTAAQLTNSGQLIIQKVIPEGKKETDFSNIF